MATLRITGRGDVTYAGPDDLDVIDFDTSGPTTATVGAGRVEPGLELRGSGFADTLVVDGIGAGFSAAGFSFGAGWGAADTVAVRDTGGDNRIVGSGRGDRITVTGGRDEVEGGGGRDTLAIDYSTRTAGFLSQALTTFDSPEPFFVIGDASGSVRVAFEDVERLDAAFGSGADSIDGLSGDDVLRGNGGNDTLGGAGGDDRLFGGAGRDTLTGGAGRDALQGGGGADRLVGGAGNDTYGVTQVSDVVVEGAGGGVDTVLAYSNATLGANVENAAAQNATGFFSIRGGGGANRIAGSDGGNGIQGGGGRDDIRLGGDEAADDVGFTDASESTGRTRDIVRGFDAAGEDTITFFAPAELGAGSQGPDRLVTRSGGLLRGASFDADLAARVDGDFAPGGDVDAVLWDPSGGDAGLPDRRVLVVDADNSGSYEAGRDYVVEFQNLQGAFTLADVLIALE